MRWQGFMGNESVKSQLAAFADQGRFPHAVLIEGPRGSGRRTLARHLAMAAVCRHEGDRPCGACVACHKAAAGKHPDITELSGTGGARSFHIDLIRTVRENAYVLPNEAPRRVFILAEAHTMTDRAQNALLKVLEEPPAQALFILTCESRAQLLSTIRSRVVSFTLAPVDPAASLQYLRERFPRVAESELSLANAVYGGLIGQAVAGLEDDTFRRIRQTVGEMARALTAPEEMPLLTLTARLIKEKETADGVLSGLSLTVRDAIVRRYAPSVATLSPEPGGADVLAASLTVPQLTALLEELEQCAVMRRRNMNPTLFSTVMCARLRRAAGH